MANYPQKSLKLVQARPLRFGIPFGQAADPSLTTNSPMYVTGREELKQAILLRLLEAKGDWFFDEDFGLPWITRREKGIYGFLGAAPPLPTPLIEAFIREEMQKEVRIKRVQNFDIQFDAGERKITVSFDVIPVDEPPFRISVAV